ncbi:MAG: TatD family hydrolase [Clostridia bacterium]|nr:TatD family hydrolase [Clostridia bacterium]
MTVFDAHAHAGEGDAQSELRQRLGIRTMLSCGTPEEAERGEQLASRFSVYTLTAGVHPWHAGHIAPADMEPFMRRAALIGEIGLDSVWCDVPMRIQRDVFTWQLDWAQRAGKAVVLHTKGCEAEIARRIAPYTVPFVVHWYSGDEDTLDLFVQKDCYFTIGPDIARNESVRAVARRVRSERLLFETDGYSAVCWALGDVPLSALGNVLRDGVREAARLRGDDPQRLCDIANGNFIRLTAG